MSDRVLRALASALAKGNGKVKIRDRRRCGKVGVTREPEQELSARREIPAQRMGHTGESPRVVTPRAREARTVRGRSLTGGSRCLKDGGMGRRGRRQME